MQFSQRARILTLAKTSVALVVLVFAQAAARADLAWQVLAEFPSNSYPSSSSPLAVYTDGTLYGSTRNGGTNGSGNLFKITPSGQLTELYSFTNGVDGAGPFGGLVLANDGNFYGVTQFAGTNGSGTIFRITPAGVFSPVCSFPGNNIGSLPNAGLMQASDGLLYGTLYYSGSNGFGGIFSSTLDGTLTGLYSFTNGVDGVNVSSVLTEGSPGELYGTSQYGGANGNGIIFKITTTGAYTVLYTFTNGVDGNQPIGGLAKLGGNFYGTTSQGGSPVFGSPNGTVFTITPSGVLTPLYAFTGGTDGSTPANPLIVGNDGNLYGSALFAGSFGGGVAYKITPSGNLTTLVSLNAATSGGVPGTLVEGADLNFYMLTTDGASNQMGAIVQFSSSVPQPGLSSQIPTTQYTALTDLYNATAGSGWNQKSGWLNASTDYWYGVTVGLIRYNSSWTVTTPAPVVELNLSFNNLIGTIPSSFANLTGMQQLFLRANTLTNGIPSELNSLRQLQQLDLSYNTFGGTIPSFLSGMTNLETLYLSSDYLTGTVPDGLTNLYQLQYLALNINSLTGSIPTGIGSLTQLFSLDFSYNILSNSVPDSIGNLLALQNLFLNQNALGGSLPDSLGNLTNMNTFYCWGNALTGVIPDAITNMFLAQDLDFSQNLFTNGLPDGIDNLTNLLYFRAHNNNLTNSIPDSITNCPQLQLLDLSANNIQGSIPSGIGNLSMLQSLYLNQNLLSGSIPDSIDDLTNLQNISLSFNSLTDAIPAGISALYQLSQVNLDNNSLSGSIPDIFGGITNLTQLTLNNNQLTGDIPQSLKSCANLNDLDLGANQLTNGIPDVLTNLLLLNTLILNQNNLTGGLPSGLGNLSQLATLDFSVNDLTGNFPATLSDLTNLNYLSLDSNQLSGAISSQFGALSNLQTLVLSRNNLSGPIPGSITNLTKLSYFDCDNNQLSGGIPTGVGNMISLQTINLMNNPLGGSIPSGIAALLNIQNIILSYDELTGSIPDIFGNLGQLSYLDLGHNSLTGSFPAGLNNAKNIAVLQVEANGLSGSLPLGFTNLSTLVYLDLSGNDLTGTIPVQYGAMPNLHTLLVYSNSLSGRFFTNAANYTDVTYNDYDFDVGNVNLTSVSQMTNQGQTVLFIPQNIPTFLTEPQGLALFAGNSASLSVNVANATAYQWFLNGNPVAGVQSNTLEFTNIQSASAGSYQLIASNSFGAATSIVATVTVAGGPPIILSEPGPASQFVTPRTVITYAAAIVGSDPITYQWKKNGANLADNGRITGSQSNILVITAALTNDSGAYQLFATNAFGSTNTVAVNLMVGTLNFTNFANVSNLVFNGTATPTNDSTNGYYIRMTTAADDEAGSVFLANPVSLAEGASFSTEFSFRLISNGADGITFSVQADGSNALGALGGGLGYQGITNSIAIQYDTYQDQGDPSANYIGFDEGGIASSIVYGTPTNKLSDGNIWFSWIDYNAATGDLEVRASESSTRPSTPIFTTNANILANLHSDLAYFGFTSATGADIDQQEILSWQLSVGTDSTNGPIISLIGNAVTNIQCHTAFTDPGATASEPGIGSLPVTVIGTFETNSVATYTILYEAVDTSGNSAVATRTINVIDTIPPVVTLIGSAVTNVECHSAWTDPGATAYDLCDGNVGAFLDQSDLNLDSPGTYTNVWGANDGQLNLAYATRVINVVDTTPPVITILGANPAYVLTNSVYTDAGATAFDACAGDLPLITNSSVNIGIIGTYAVTYIATDPSGNAATNTRTVNVVGSIVSPVSFVPGSEHVTNGHPSFIVTNLVNQGPVIIGTSTNLLQWTPIYTNPSGFGSFQFIDSNSPAVKARFYRATVP